MGQRGDTISHCNILQHVPSFLILGHPHQCEERLLQEPLQELYKCQNIGAGYIPAMQYDLSVLIFMIARSYEHKWEFPKIRGTFLGVRIVRIIVFGGLYLGPPILGNYQIVSMLEHESLQQAAR